MRHGTIPCVALLVTALGTGACAAQTGSASLLGPTASSTVSAKRAPHASDSILLFDGDENSAKLVADMAAGVTPTQCTVLYDQMGSLPSVTVTDENTIAEVYDLLANVVVEGESQYSLTDNYHSVSFVLQDGTKVWFSFEGEKILSRGRTNYDIEGSGPLWAYVRTLQADVTGGRNAYAIDVQDDSGIVLDCPTSAEEGASVMLVCSTESSEDIHACVNGEELTRSDEIYVSKGGSDEMTPAHKRKFEFLMPSSNVEVKVTVGSSAL